MSGLPISARGLVELTHPAGVRRQGEQMIRRLRLAAANIEPVVEYTARALKEEIRRQFRVGGDPPWAPLATNTLAARGGRAKALGGPGGGIFSGGRGVRVVALAAANRQYAINVWARFPGLLHQEGRTGPWTIRPKTKKALRFTVASPLGALVIAQIRRNPKGGLFTAGSMRFARSVRHPGYPARPFVRVTPSFVRREFSVPLLRFLREGGVPARSAA